MEPYFGAFKDDELIGYITLNKDFFETKNPYPIPCSEMPIGKGSKSY